MRRNRKWLPAIVAQCEIIQPSRGRAVLINHRAITAPVRSFSIVIVGRLVPLVAEIPAAIDTFQFVYVFETVARRDALP